LFRQRLLQTSGIERIFPRTPFFIKNHKSGAFQQPLSSTVCPRLMANLCYIYATHTSRALNNIRLKFIYIYIYKHVKCNGDNVLAKHTCRYAHISIEKEKRAKNSCISFRPPTRRKWNNCSKPFNDKEIIASINLSAVNGTRATYVCTI